MRDVFPCGHQILEAMNGMVEAVSISPRHTDGDVRPGDAIQVDLPPPPHRPLQPV
jgi:hypothetical protein